ncbi:hypothetical protein DL96DRAFT_1631468 [Flagelloscypha sp. PMI_526]|nr:hypothetical protein DL96DRAFT_1631468 [Flagelloscypha sp. PMI_526]
MASFPDVPIDIARIIFESAALSDRSTARVLSCVSQGVQFWSDPLLFRNIVIEDEGTISRTMVDFMDYFISENPSSRIRQARDYVRGFSTKQSSDEDDRVLHFVSRCTALESLCLWSMDLNPSLTSITIPSLRRLSFSWANRSFISLNAPLCRPVTHLELDSADGSTIGDIGLSSLGSLTHLILVLKQERDMHSVISTISSNLPPQLEVSLVIVRKAEKALLDGAAFDERIVFGLSPNGNRQPTGVSVEMEYSYDHVWDTWTGRRSESHSCWVEAERLLKEKRSKMTA